MQIPLGDFDAGLENQPLMAIEDQYFSPNICYEDLFGEELLNQLFAHADSCLLYTSRCV